MQFTFSITCFFKVLNLLCRVSNQCTTCLNLFAFINFISFASNPRSISFSGLVLALWGWRLLAFALMLPSSCKVGTKTLPPHLSISHPSHIHSDQVEITPQSKGNTIQNSPFWKCIWLKTSGSAVTNQDIRWHYFPSLTICRARVQICMSVVIQPCYKQAVWYSRNNNTTNNKRRK